MKKFSSLLSILVCFIAFVFIYRANRFRFFSLINRYNYDRVYPNESYFAVSFKDIIPCPQKSIKIGYFGQSNHGNIIKREETIEILQNNIFIYDWRLGVCSRYKEPLAGVGGSAGGYGHISSDTIYSLQNKHDFKQNIIIFGFTKGGSKANDWSEGMLSNKLEYFLNRLKKDNFEIDYVLWHQGESEIKNANKIYYKEYIEDIKKIFKKFLEASNKTKIGMALVSFCNSEKSNYLINAQESIIRSNDRIFLTLNTDKLGNKYRYDGCHFNSLGSAKIGEKYSDLIYNLEN